MLNIKWRPLLKQALVVLVLMITSTQSVIAMTTEDEAFEQVANDFFDHYFYPHNPALATQLGIHDYDDKLKDYSQAGIQATILQLKSFEQRIEAINPASLREEYQSDREIIIHYCRSQQLTLETIRPWEKNPAYYTSEVSRGMHVLMKRRFASTNRRLASLIAREQLIPGVLEEARKNLKNPPRVYTEIALEQLPSVLAFFKKDIPRAFAETRDPALSKALVISNSRVIKALSEYQDWLKKTLLPQSHGDFRIGAEAFSKKLQYDEMVDTPLDELLAIGYQDLRKNQEAYQRLSTELQGRSSMLRLQPDEVLPVFSNSFAGLIKFIQEKNLITIPFSVPPTTQETPPFIRVTSSASMDTPGPFEHRAKEAFLNVTVSKKGRNKNNTLRDINYASITMTAIHEAYPGHYVQFLWMHTLHNRVRQILGSKTNSEGWAHYCEQMMLDEGYGGDANTLESKLLRLGQIKKALLRNARFIVGIKMHTGAIKPAEAIDFFVKEGHQSHAAAVREVKRGTIDPTYLYYTLGKLQILALREEVQKKQGEAFSLQQFHDDFMRQGRPPIKIVRRALLKEA